MKWLALFLVILSSCSSGKEVVMPFKNLAYSGERILPVKTSTAEYSLRIWVNNSTSIDRVISISKDSFEDYSGYLTEIGVLLNGKKKSEYYRQIKITPKSGFQAFRKKVDKLKLLKLPTQSGSLPMPLHQPFSNYIVEIKDQNEFNIFQFKSYYPYKGQIDEVYAAIENLIFDEFDVRQYFKLKE